MANPSSTRVVFALLPVIAALVAACGSEARRGFDDTAELNEESGDGTASEKFDTQPEGEAPTGSPECNASSGDMAGCACDPGTTRSCYTGPADTRSVGVCKDGVQECKSTAELGGGWGPCSGAIAPSNEDCRGTVDTNCNGKIGCDDPTCASDKSCQPDCTDGDTKPCYTGPAGTANVGICTPGVNTCVNGKWSTTCSGQILPTPETCTDGTDNDCDGQIDCADPSCSFAPSCCTPTTTNVDGTIWANSSSTLYRIDPNTLAVTTVGTFASGEEMTDVAVTPDGVLYGVSFTTLYTIDKTTAKATALVEIGGSGNNSLTFLQNGTLLASDSSGAVKVINPTTGVVTTIGSYGNGLTSSGDVVAVQNGTMYGISKTKAGGGDASSSNVLVRVDPNSGAATAVGATGKSEVWGLAYAKSKVIGFTTAGQILQIDPQTGASTVVATKNVVFWGAGQSPLVPQNGCL